VLGAAAVARCVQRALISELRAAADPARAGYVREHSRDDWRNTEAALQTLDAAANHFLTSA
jgi:hypothetical protein